MNIDFDDIENHTITIYIGGIKIDCSESKFLLESPLIRREQYSPIYIDMDVTDEEFSLISKFLRKKILNIDSKPTYKLFKKLNKYLKISYLGKKLCLYKQNINIPKIHEFNILSELYQTVILFIYNLEETIERSSEIINHTGTKLFVRTVLYAILSNPYHTEDYIALLLHLPKQTESFECFCEVFESEYVEILKDNQFKNEVFYIAYYLISQGLIEKEKILPKSVTDVPLMFVDLLDIDPSEITQKNVKSNFFYENLSILSENNWELHKKLVKEGVNPNPIATSIRKDDLESLKSYIYNPYFDPGMILEKSIYERTTISSKNLNLIEYSAFHNSINCLEYLIETNNSRDFNNKMLIKCMVCGNCTKLIGDPSIYKDFLRYAVCYHNFNIIRLYLDEVDTFYDKDIINLAKLMIYMCEFQGFFYFIQKVMVFAEDLDELSDVAEKCHCDLLVKFISDIKRTR